MTDYEALGIVLDLAIQSALEDSDEMPEEYYTQQQALDRIDHILTLTCLGLLLLLATLTLTIA